MLTVEIGLNENLDCRKEVEVYFDKEGLDFLLNRLQQLKDGKTDHYNLMTKSWGDGELTEEKHKENNLLAHHLRLTLINQQKPLI